MAIIHKASVSPTKAELLERIFGEAVTVLGTYRFDDPDGEVGVEAFIARCGATTRQIVLTYRGVPLEQTVHLSVVPGPSPAADAAPAIARDLDQAPERTLGVCLRAAWNGGDAIVASIGTGLSPHRCAPD